MAKSLARVAVPWHAFTVHGSQRSLEIHTTFPETNHTESQERMIMFHSESGIYKSHCVLYPYRFVFCHQCVGVTGASDPFSGVIEIDDSLPRSCGGHFTVSPGNGVRTSMSEAEDRFE
jgi:hypothetical protein